MIRGKWKWLLILLAALAVLVGLMALALRASYAC